MGVLGECFLTFQLQFALSLGKVTSSTFSHIFRPVFFRIGIIFLRYLRFFFYTGIDETCRSKRVLSKSVYVVLFVLLVPV